MGLYKERINMYRILSKESVKLTLYAKSDFNLGSPADDIYRLQVDEYLDNVLFDDVLDVVFDGQYSNLYHEYHKTQR